MLILYLVAIHPASQMEIVSIVGYLFSSFCLNLISVAFVFRFEAEVLVGGTEEHFTVGLGSYRQQERVPIVVSSVAGISFGEVCPHDG